MSKQKKIIIAVSIVVVAAAAWFIIDKKYSVSTRLDVKETVNPQKSVQLTGKDISGLPLDEVPPQNNNKKSLIVLVSGDGGWGGTEINFANDLTHYGFGVIGVNTFRYFKDKKTPEQFASDLSAIIKYYGDEWQKPRVILLGYSFGADTLPTTYNLLDDATKQKIDAIALMSPSNDANFVIKAQSFLNKQKGPSVIDALNQIQNLKIYCFYGVKDKVSICPKLDPSKYTVISFPGDHRVAKDYNPLLNKIVDNSQ